MEFALWSGVAVSELIERQFKVSLHLRSVGKYLNRWGFTPQKPIKRAYEQSPEAVRTWLDDTYPAIAERAKAEQRKSTGATKSRWSTRMCVVAATHRAGKHLWRWSWAVPVRSCR